MKSSFDFRRRGSRAAQVSALAVGLALALFACAALLIPGKASAASFEITPYGGYAWWDTELKLKDNVAYGGRAGLYFGLLGIEGNFMYSPAEYDPVPATGSAKTPVTNYGGDLVLRFVKEGAVVPYILGGAGRVQFSPDDPSKEDTKVWGFDVGAGLLFKLGTAVGLRLEVRDLIHNFWVGTGTGFNEDLRNNIIATGGLSLIFGGEKDTDKDKVKDSKDQCPDTPLGCIVDELGCPIDTDKDGVCDGIDQCADTQPGCTVDARGCPSDTDNDGVCDGRDQCANTPTGAPVDDKGCPKDSDGDGVPDHLDQCPNTASGFAVDEKGCPLDTDGDGVSDDKDLCPNTPAGVKVDKDGCPIEITEREKEMLDKGTITVRTIPFQTAKWDIMPVAEPTLKELGQVFIQWPRLQIEVGGHCDARGSDKYNQELSEKRANSVRDYLLASFPQLNPANFSAMGYGEGKPVATNKTQTGMALNRRVEFKVLNTEELEKVKERRRMLQQGE